MDALSILVFYCDICQAEYLYKDDTWELLTYSIYTAIDNKTYRWSMAGETAQLWFIREPGIPGVKKNKGLHSIQVFGKVTSQLITPIPDITPTNINDKLKIILTFQ